MRRTEFRGEAALGLELFRQAPAVHLAGVDGTGRPVLKTLHGVVEGDWLYFHSAPAGEKTSLVGTEVVVSTEETVAHVPSYFMDPQRACPATTLYRSAQASGQLTAVEDLGLKATVLGRLMEKFQPEGGHVPIEADHPLYRAPVRGLLIAGVSLAQLATKIKLGQNRTPEQRAVLLQRLWERGHTSDVRAIELIREANVATPVPEFLKGPEGLTLHPWLSPRSSAEAARLVEAEYWNDQFTLDELQRAHLGSSAWVGARDASGILVGTARALADGGKCAWVYDVCVRADWRRRGVGGALMKLLLEHPAIRRCRAVHLGTKDAQGLYARFGFVPTQTLPKRPYESTNMTLWRQLA